MQATRRRDPSRTTHSGPDALLCVGLLLVTCALYSQVYSFSFVNLDDLQGFVLGDPRVRGGITSGGVMWALTSRDAGWWFPLTRLSHMLDCQLFDLRSGWHHLTSVFLHACSALLLFVLLNRATRARWPSAFAALVFAVHPLHVESVAWIAERKDVLAGSFFLMTLWMYVRYTETRGWLLYAISLLSYCAGLMAKSMIVTLPFILLLFDVWPLGRLRSVREPDAGRFRATWRRILLEKVPFAALSAGACVMTYLAQRDLGALKALNAYPMGLRIENALLSYVVYIAKTLWPSRLAVFYPYPEHLSVWEAAGAGLTVAMISLLVLRSFRARPYLAIGWLWYLGMLVPVIGLIQAGEQARADRYMYLPMIGLSIMAAYILADVLKSRPRARPAIVFTGAAACSLFGVLTWVQVQYWRNSQTLFEHAIAVTERNYLAHACLGSYFLVEVPGRLPGAISHLEEAVRLNPNQPEARSNLGFALLTVPERLPEAIGHLEAAVRLRPDLAEAHNNLAAALLQVPGRSADAVWHRNAALRINPHLQSPQELLDRARRQR